MRFPLSSSSQDCCGFLGGIGYYVGLMMLYGSGWAYFRYSWIP